MMVCWVRSNRLQALPIRALQETGSLASRSVHVSEMAHVLNRQGGNPDDLPTMAMGLFSRSSVRTSAGAARPKQAGREPRRPTHHGDGLDGGQQRAHERGRRLLHGQPPVSLVAVRLPPRAQALLLQRLIRPHPR